MLFVKKENGISSIKKRNPNAQLDTNSKSDIPQYIAMYDELRIFDSKIPHILIARYKNILEIEDFDIICDDEKVAKDLMYALYINNK